MKFTENTAFKVLLTIFLLISNTIYSQNSYFEEWYSADTEHLPQNSVKSIAPDKYGFIWMTTENGLVRFDGKNFKIFNTNNINTLSNRFLYLYGSIENDSLQTFTEHYANNIIINKRNAKKVKENYLHDDYENTRFFLNNNIIQKANFLNATIKKKNGDYYKIEKSKIIYYNKVFKKKAQKNLTYNSKNDYLLLNDELIILKSNGDCTFYNSLETNKITIPKNSKFIYNFLTQQYFICSETEIFLLKKSTNKIYLSLLHKLESNRQYDIKCIYYNMISNKLFIGTNNKGLVVITKNKFNVLTNKNSIDNNYYATLPISSNTFFTAKGELFNTEKLLADLKLNKTGNQYGIAEKKKKNIWIQDDVRLTRYFKKTNYKTSDYVEFDFQINAVFCDSKNKIWVGFKNTLKNIPRVTIIDPKNQKITPIPLENIVEPVNFFAETKNNTIIMASAKKIIEYDVAKNKVKKTLSGKNDIRSIFICKDNKIWACTYSNGFSLFENGVFYKMPNDTNLFLISAHGIIEDEKGHFWISTNKGLIEVDKKSLLNYHQTKSPVYYQHYDTKNGFITNEFNGGCQPCNSKLSNGYFVFPSLNGLVVFHPEKINKITPKNDFFINEVEADNKTIFFNDSVTLSRDYERIKFKIDFPYFGNKNNICFEAKLLIHGNEKWILLNNERSITFTNLPPGNHKLIVRKLNDFSSTYSTKTTYICIPFLYYEMLWFKILIIALILGLIVLGIRLRYNYLKKKNYMLEKIILERTKDLKNTVESLKNTKNNLSQEIIQQKKLIGTISHDIKSPLKFLSITAKHLHDKSLISENDDIKSNAKIMHESSIHLYTFVENLVDYSKIFLEHNTLNENDLIDVNIIITDKIDFFKNIAEAKGLKLTHMNLLQSSIKLNKKVVGIIVHNLLDNAIKNTHTGTISIETKTAKNILYLSVKDSGTGMPIEIKNYYLNLLKNYETDKLVIQNYGLGLHMVLELLRLLKGDLKIDSNEKEGTIVTVIIDSY